MGQSLNSMTMKVIAIVAAFTSIAWLPTNSIAEDDFDADGFLAFQSICLHDERQFSIAQDNARDLQTAPEPLKSQLLDQLDGEIWILGARPLITLTALSEGGCGVGIKPVREDYLSGFSNSIPGQNIAENSAVGASWAKWFIIDTNENKGVLLISLLDLNGVKSAHNLYDVDGGDENCVPAFAGMTGFVITPSARDAAGNDPPAPAPSSLQPPELRECQHRGHACLW